MREGVLYDDLMRRLNIPAKRRGSFKRLFFSQVFFGKIKTTGRVRELFARDFPNVFKAINDLKRKDYRQQAYLHQAHESKLMIHLIRGEAWTAPGTYLGQFTIQFMTTPDKAEVGQDDHDEGVPEVRIEPNDQARSILICCNCPVSGWSDLDDRVDQQSQLLSRCVRTHRG